LLYKKLMETEKSSGTRKWAWLLRTEKRRFFGGNGTGERIDVPVHIETKAAVVVYPVDQCLSEEFPHYLVF